MYKLFLLAGTISGTLSVMIGAFGAHALKSKLLANGRLDIFETAVKYQFYHSLALMVLGILMLVKFESKLMDYAGYSFIAGILVFSGSLYILCLTNVGKWGAVTPFGGLFLIAGWLLMFTAILNYK